MFELTIKGRTPKEPRDRVLALEAAAKAICMEAGEDVADGVMALLTAAAHLTLQHSDCPTSELAETLAASLGNAVDAAEHFFPRSPRKH